ncbi:MAG: cysteine desulfurase [Parcubacteria bacterium C7867-008]|nr:MAG: cysteine desulfurase [Parcubacteria bacterium C7867-008]
MHLGKKRTYLDWASAAPVSKRARMAFDRALAMDGNPSSPHAEGRAAKKILEDARTTIARLAEVKADGVIFTSGATEANNLALSGFVQELRAKNPAQKLHLLYLPTAHSSIIETVKMLAHYGVEIEPLKLSEGSIDLQALTKQIKPETALVTVDAVCGETGIQFDTRDVRRTLDAVRAGIVLHVDASQLPRIGPFELTRLGADLLTLDAQKVGGVRGIGALVVRHGVSLSPITHGGGQEHGLRPGTEVPALAASFAEALTETKEAYATFVTRAQADRTKLIETTSTAIPDVHINEGKQQAPHILNLSFVGRDTDYAVALLDQAGFAVSTKSACETDAEGSRVVLCVTGDSHRAASTLRISWGASTSSRDLERFATAVIRTIRFLDAHRL